MKGSFWFYAILAAVLAVAGQASNALSKSACRKDAMFWYAHVLLAGQHFYLELHPGQEAELRAFDAAGAPYTLLKGAVYIHPTLAEGLWTLMEAVTAV